MWYSYIDCRGLKAVCVEISWEIEVAELYPESVGRYEFKKWRKSGVSMKILLYSKEKILIARTVPFLSFVSSV